MSTAESVVAAGLSKRDRILLGRRREHVFYTAMAVAAIALASIGFSGTVQREFGGTSKLTLLVHVHAAIAAAWLFLFLVQVRLIASNNFRLHRQIGAIALFFALAHVLIGFRTATIAAHRGFDLSGGNDPVAFMIFPLGDLLAFSLLVCAGLAFRRRAAAHKRFMLLAITTMLGAPLQHFVADNPAGTPFMVPMLILLWFSSAAFDRLTLGRIHPVSLWGGVALFLWGNSRAFVLQHTEAWHSIGNWLITQSQLH